MKQIKLQPNELKQKGQFFTMGSKFNKAEYETFTWNYIVISSKSGKWLESFTYKEYEKLCDHDPHKTNDYYWIVNMLPLGYFNLINDRYYITDKFVDVINDLIDKENAGD
jgi:predicted acetyltransferase